MIRFATIFLLCCMWAVNLTAHGADIACSRYQQTANSADILNAIGAGQIKQLIACGLSINGPIPVQGEQMTLLQFAASLGKPSLVEQVLNAGADPNFGGTGEIVLFPLEVALASGKYDAARVLIKHKARADYALPELGTTALMALAFEHKFSDAARDMVALLVEHGADVNAADAKGNTPLHWAALSGNTTYAQVLLDLQADACIKNKKGQRPVDVIPKERSQWQSLLHFPCDAVQ